MREAEAAGEPRRSRRLASLGETRDGALLVHAHGGKARRVDAAGALLYRAQGFPQGAGLVCVAQPSLVPIQAQADGLGLAFSRQSVMPLPRVYLRRAAGSGPELSPTVGPRETLGAEPCAKQPRDAQRDHH